METLSRVPQNLNIKVMRQESDEMGDPRTGNQIKDGNQRGLTEHLNENRSLGDCWWLRGLIKAAGKQLMEEEGGQHPTQEPWKMEAKNG